MQFIDSTAIVPRTRKVITKMANPIADSAAATVGTNKANDWPIISSKETENTKKFELTANNIDSIGIDIIGIFRLLRRIPRIPKIEMIIENVKYLIGSVSETWNLREIQIMWGKERSPVSWSPGRGRESLEKCRRSRPRWPCGENRVNSSLPTHRKFNSSKSKPTKKDGRNYIKACTRFRASRISALCMPWLSRFIYLLFKAVTVSSLKKRVVATSSRFTPGAREKLGLFISVCCLKRMFSWCSFRTPILNECIVSSSGPLYDYLIVQL